MDRLMDMKRSGEDDPVFGREIPDREMPLRKSERDAIAAVQARAAGLVPTRSPVVETDNEVFKPPFTGSRVARGIPLDEIASYLNQTTLFRNQWGLRPEGGETDAEFKERVSGTLREQLAIATTRELLTPQVAWGYFPANGDGDDLVIFSDESRATEAARFHLPRQATEPYLCIADFFRPLVSGETDWASFMVVTQGARVSEETARLFAENRYQEYLYLHGLGVEMAEALAEYWHRRIRDEWGFGEEDGPTLWGLFRQQYRGGRYSFGYPACPDLEDNATVVSLVDASRIGVTVSEGFQLHPEQTTLALICHHPKAKYFVAR